MSIIDIPTQTEDSLGQEKVDGPSPYDAASDINSGIWNRLVTRVIAAFEAIGLDDGSTAGSLRAAVASMLMTLDSISNTLDDKVDSDDERLTDQRIPTQHASSHYSFGNDPLDLASLGAVAADDSRLSEASASSSGILSADDYDLLHPMHGNRSLVLFDDEFCLNISGWGTLVAGTSASVALYPAAGTHPSGRVGLSTGTTPAGEAYLRSPINGFFIGSIRSFRYTAIVGFTALSDGVDSFQAFVCGAYPPTYATPGFAVMYDHTVSPNWQIVRFGGGGILEAADTGIAVTASISPPYGPQRVELVYDSVAGTLTAFINGVEGANKITGSLAGASAVYHIPARMVKTLGSANRVMVVDRTAMVVTPIAGVRP